MDSLHNLRPVSDKYETFVDILYYVRELLVPLLRVNKSELKPVTSRGG